MLSLFFFHISKGSVFYEENNFFLAEEEEVLFFLIRLKDRHLEGLEGDAAKDEVGVSVVSEEAEESFLSTANEDLGSSFTGLRWSR